MNKPVQWNLPVRYMAFGAMFLMFVLGLWYIRSVLEPLIVAAFISYLINPAVNYLALHRRMTRRSAVNVVYFVALAFLIGVPSTLTPIFFNEFQRVITDLLNLYSELIMVLEEAPALPGIPLDLGALADRLTQFRATFLSSLPDQALQLLEASSLGALWIIVILVAVYYFLSEWPHLRSSLIGSLPRAYQPEVNQLYRRVRRVWMNYLRSQILLMIIVGVAFTVAWTIIGIPGALVLGVVAGFLTLDPDVGPFLAAVLAWPCWRAPAGSRSPSSGSR
jgi:predicted PurR-regulated permease PerM